MRNHYDNEINIMVSVVGKIQTYIRNLENDVSSVSLRDVKRFTKLLIWFYNVIGEGTPCSYRCMCIYIIIYIPLLL
jgi:hypothetical protein